MIKCGWRCTWSTQCVPLFELDGGHPSEICKLCLDVLSLHSSNYQWRLRKGFLLKSICHPDKLASYSRPVMKNIVLLISVQNFCLSMCCSTRVPSLKIRCWWCLFSIFQRLMFVSNHSNCSGQSWIFEWMRLTPS